MIPKIIHYCWFGGAPLSERTKRYMDTWRARCPDYEIRRWDESSFDLERCAYVKEAYAAKKWAFLTDYVRLWALNEYGGVYMDTDVELVRPLDRFLSDPAFCGFENDDHLSTAVMGSEPGGVWVRTLLADYKDRHFLLPDGSCDLTTNVAVVSGRTEQSFGIVMNGAAQRAEGALAVYPRDWFSPMTFSTGRLAVTDDTCAIHHFVASWHDEVWQRERDVRYRCVRLFGEKLGERAANAVNFARRRDGSFSRAVGYYLRLPLTAAFGLLPLSDTLVFETEGDFCDNGRALYEFLLSRGVNRRRRIVWLVKEPERFRAGAPDNVLFLRWESLAAKYHIGRARYFFFTHPWWMKRWRKGQTVVNLWHGVPLKSGAGNDLHETFDFLVISSPEGFELYQKFLGAQPRQLLPLGQPRLDLMFRKTDPRGLLGGRERGKDYEKLALCMPTFRQSKYLTDGAFPNAFTINPVETVEQLEALNGFLRDNRTLLVSKIHHLQKLDFLERTSLSNILYLTDDDLAAQNAQLYELVGQADLLLTDYSSIYFDYLLLDRPIGFFVGDLEQYTRGFLVDDPLAWMPGEKIRDLDGLYAFLKDVLAGRDGYGPDRKALLDRIDAYQDGENCRRIADHFGL